MAGAPVRRTSLASFECSGRRRARSTLCRGTWAARPHGFGGTRTAGASGGRFPNACASGYRPCTRLPRRGPRRDRVLPDVLPHPEIQRSPGRRHRMPTLITDWSSCGPNSSSPPGTPTRDPSPGPRPPTGSSPKSAHPDQHQETRREQHRAPAQLRTPRRQLRRQGSCFPCSGARLAMAGCRPCVAKVAPSSKRRRTIP